MDIRDIKEWSNDAMNLYEKLQDEESRKLFMWKMESLFTNNLDTDTLRIVEMYNDWTIPQEYKQDIVIYGCGQRGETLSKLLKHWGLNQVCFCETKLMNEHECCGKKVISVDKAVKEYPEALFLISSQIYGSEMVLQLTQRNVSEGKIKRFRLPYPSFTRGLQYFDVFKAGSDEIFCDGGAFDGGTTRDFFLWGGKKAYVMEPQKDMYEKIVSDFNSDSNVIIENVAIWDRNEELSFKLQSAGSMVSKEGSVSVTAKAIDEIVRDDKVTFIKMDIEGSEYKAICGAEKTIKQNKPKLAICVYHKANDLVELATLISSIVPEYKFYIRHYTSSMEETVLYAEV